MTDDRWQNQWHDSFSSTFYSFSRKFKLNFKVSALKALKWAVIRRSQLAAIGSTFSPGDGRDIYGCVCRFKLTKFSWITGRREVGCLWLAAAKILRSHRRREEPAARQHSSCTFYWFSAQYGFPATKDQSGPKFRPPIIALKILKVHFFGTPCSIGKFLDSDLNRLISRWWTGP